MRRFHLSWTLVLFLLLAVPAAHAQPVIYVDGDATGASDGTSWTDAYTDVQTAIANATAGDSLWIAEGVYTPASASDSIAFTGSKDGIAIFGGFDGTESTRTARAPNEHPTILSGDVAGDDVTGADGVTISPADIVGPNSNHVLFLDGTVNGAITENTVIDGVTVTGGKADASGPAYGRYGGGLMCDGSNGNECNPTLRNVIFVGNLADSRGGAIYNNGYSGASSPTIKNAVFLNNTANTDGGALFNDGENVGVSSPIIVNAVFTGNTASSNGGAMFNDGLVNGLSEPQITNTILWGNSSTSDGDELYNANTAATLAYSIIQGGVNGSGIGGASNIDNGGNISLDPRFSRPAMPAGPDGTMGTADDGLAVRPGSPALDAGANGIVTVSNDLTGSTRIEDNNNDGTATVDLGPYEGSVEPQIFRVDASSSAGSPDGLSWGSAFSDLQSALSIAIGTDEIWVTNGVYVPGSDQSASFNFFPEQDGLELYGGFAGGETNRSARDPSANVTVLSGDIDGDDQRTGAGVTPDTASISGPNAEHVLVMSGTSGRITQNTVVDGVTITGGQADGGVPNNRGGGLWCNGFGLDECSPTLTNVRFIGNAAEEGGALYNEGGVASPTITSAVFAGNGADLGGGIYNRGGTETNPFLTNVLFVRNEARKGGAMINVAAGGTANPSVLNATFVGNTGVEGGAIFDSTSSGGTVAPRIDNSILWGNRASAGAQVYNRGDGVAPVFDHSLIEHGAAEISENSGSTTGFLDGGDIIVTFFESTNLDRDPQFEYTPLPAGDDAAYATADDGLHLTPGSPALDAGDTAVLDTTGNASRDITADLTAAARVKDDDGDGTADVDLGAYEGARDQARTVFVDRSATGNVDGTSWASADTTLQDPVHVGTGALGYVTGNDEVWVAQGVYTPGAADTSLTIRGIQDGVSLYGGFDGSESVRSNRDPSAHVTVLSGDVGSDDTRNSDGVTPDTSAIAGPNADHVLVLDGESLGPITSATVLSGFTITGGQANGTTPDNRGGGLYCNGAVSGGECSPTLRDLVFKGNLADSNGGALYNAGTNGAASPVLRDVFFVNNLARFSGGAIYNDGGSGQSSPTLTNTVFANNTAYNDGGAVYNLGNFTGEADPTIRNATFAGNRAERDGGAIVNRGGSNSGTAAPSITNSILWGNTASAQGVTGDDQVYNDLGTPVFTHSIVEGSGGSTSWTTGLGTDNGGNLDQDPQFRAAATPAGGDGLFGTVDDSLNLTPGSAALDAGLNDSVSVATDVLGDSRTQDLDANGTATVNIGAYETPVTTAPLPSAPGISTVADSSVSLTGTVNPGGTQTTVQMRVYPSGSPTQDTLVAVNENPLSGFVGQPVTTSIPGLLPGTSYETDVVASSTVATDTGSVATFTTQAAAPLPTAGSVSGRSDTSATINGTVNPAGALTRVYLEFGRANTSGRTLIALDTLQSNLLSDQSVLARPDTLTSATKYEFAVVAASAVDSVTSDTIGFQTANAPPTTGGLATRARSAAATRLAVLPAVNADGIIDTSSVRIESAPAHGTATANADGTVTYTHDGSTELTDQFTYSVADKAGQRSAPATVSISVVSITAAEGSAKRGSPLSIDVAVDGSFAPTTDSTLYARPGGTSTYQALPLSASGTNQLSGQVPASLVTTRGVDYYVALSDSAGTLTIPAGGPAAASEQPRHAPVQFDSLRSPLPATAETYQMISVPAVPNAGVREALRSRYGPYNAQRWRALRWDAGSNQYREYPQIDTLGPGMGLWLVTAGGETLSIGGGRTVDADTAAQVVLEPGWTQVGSPYGYAVPWDTVLAASGLTETSVDGPVGYESGTYQRGASHLEPWRGYFVFNAQTQPDTLVIPPVGGGSTGGSARPAALAGTGAIGRSAPPTSPTAGTSTKRSGARAGAETDAGTRPAVQDARTEQTGAERRRRKNEPTSTRSSAPGYTLRVEAQPKGGRAHRVWLGLRDGAKAGRDSLDFAQAPPLDRSVTVSVVEPVAGRTVPHAGSFKPTAPDGRAWTLRLHNRSSSRQAVRLQFQAAGRLPSGQKRYVLDLKTGTRLTPGQVLKIPSGTRRPLKVIVGTKTYARQHSEDVPLHRYETTLRGNYPNPFGEETTLEYTLSKKQKVTIEVYNVLGQRVRTLVRGTKDAGLHRIRWEGENRYGEPVGSGVYFYRLEAGSVTTTRKMVLVR